METIGKIRFCKDIKRSLWMFDKLVWTVWSGGMGLEGKERNRKDSGHRYIRRILRVEERTSGYLIRAGIKR